MAAVAHQLAVGKELALVLSLLSVPIPKHAVNVIWKLQSTCVVSASILSTQALERRAPLRRAPLRRAPLSALLSAEHGGLLSAVFELS